MRIHMKATALVLAVALVASAGPASANGPESSNQLVGRNSNVTVWVDKTPRNIGDGLRQAWTLWLHREPQQLAGEPEKLYQTVRLLVLVRCQTRDHAFRQAAYYKLGTTDSPISTWALSMDAATSDMQVAVPGSIAESIVEAICAKK